MVGDTLLDRDIDGDVDRLCPDTPAPVLDERDSAERPGGAGLAALLARAGDRVADDPGVTLVTALADDPGGARLSELLTAAGVRVHGVPVDGRTPEKVRLRSGGQTLLRLDRGGAGPVHYGEPAEAALAALRQASVILVSDYGRGLLRQPALRAALATTPAPVVWDPHPRGPAPVPNVRLATPNESEVRRLAGRGDRIAAATRGGHALRRRWRAGAVAVTLGELGALLCRASPTPLVVPAPRSVDGDTCGAGDRFAISAATALAGGASTIEAVQAAVADATCFVASGGVMAALAVPQPPPAAAGDGAQATGELVARVRARGGRVVATGGCFDLLHAGHVETLRAARQLGDCLVVCLNSDASVARRKGPDRPVTSQADRVRVLSALRWVDAVVVFDEPTPEAVLTWLRPDVWVKGGDYDLDYDGEPALPEAELVGRWDGQAVLVPYLDGRSTTALLTAGVSNGNGRSGTR